MGELNLAHAIMVLECDHNIGKGDGEVGSWCRVQPVLYDDWQVWPNTQQLAHRGSLCAENTKVQTPWIGEDNMSPSSAHMHKPVPRKCGAQIVCCIHSIEVENDQEDIVWEHVDYYMACMNNSDGFSGDK